MQIKSVQTQSSFGNLQIDDRKISKNYQKAIQYEINDEVKKLDRSGFDVVVKHEPYSLENFETKNSDVFLKSKIDNKELYISTLYRDTHYSFSDSLKALKEILKALTVKK